MEGALNRSHIIISLTEKTGQLQPEVLANHLLLCHWLLTTKVSPEILTLSQDLEGSGVSQQD